MLNDWVGPGSEFGSLPDDPSPVMDRPAGARRATVPEDEIPPMSARISFGLAIVSGMLSLPAGASDAPTALEVLPARSRLSGPEAVQRLVVLGVLADSSR